MDEWADGYGKTICRALTILLFLGGTGYLSAA